MHVLHVHDAGKKKKKTTLARLDQQPTGHTQNTASFHVQYGAFHLMHGVLNSFTLPKSSAVTARPHCGLVSLELMSVKSPPDCSNHHEQQIQHKKRSIPRSIATMHNNAPPRLFFVLPANNPRFPNSMDKCWVKKLLFEIDQCHLLFYHF